MSLQRIVVIPETNFVEEQPNTSKVVDDPTSTQKLRNVTLPQGQPSSDGKNRKKCKQKHTKLKKQRFQKM